MTINSSNVIANNQSVVENDPILMQTKAHPSRTQRYVTVTSMDVLEVFQNEGFSFELLQKTRKRGKRNQPVPRGAVNEFGPHLVALYREDLFGTRADLLTEMRPQILLRNSYNGQTCLELSGGIHRMICSNGLKLSLGIFPMIKLKHIGITAADIQQATNTAVQQFKNVCETIDTLKETNLTYDERMHYARTVAMARLEMGGVKEEILEVNFETLLTVNREEDNTTSAWHVLNTVQENLFSFQNRKELVYTCKTVDQETGKVDERDRKTSRVLGALGAGTNLNRFLFDSMIQQTQKEELLIAA